MRVFLISLILSTAIASAADADGLTLGKAAMQSAGPLAFSPEGILFVGDSLGAQVFALDPADTVPSKLATIKVDGLHRKIAAALGTSFDQLRIHDFKIHPRTKRVYISVSRGRGVDAFPVILRLEDGGNFTELPLNRIRYASVRLPGVPDESRTRRRTLAITDLGYVDGKVLVAGLSNEEFSSNLRVIPFPFRGANSGASIEIYHTSHLTYETDSPVRTFLPLTLNGESHILAAYTCTPLVKIPLRELQPGAKVRGATIAELGRHSSPLDMIAYQKDGHAFLLVANTGRGVLQIPADHLADLEELTPENVNTTQEPPIKRIPWLKGAVQLEKWDEENALVLMEWRDSIDLLSMPLP